ncbi:hypothetical protein G7K_0287-t3 [Saitoella complicata NRRL Y-17804]|uniref:Uncharacterized protein n=1 Tax=Saitoella complicata (strain BCRC 22490 / CBS 7301 / JCM 7358 / NBRC 10748 / NRRL Y-17804) TaxID=698492 RepID=A0A0E9N801_SAICN|nr:hypothetical protein G7K_0287-t3 [Saitoella complicata NRRL Y-17804]
MLTQSPQLGVHLLRWTATHGQGKLQRLAGSQSGQRIFIDQEAVGRITRRGEGGSMDHASLTEVTKTTFTKVRVHGSDGARASYSLRAGCNNLKTFENIDVSHRNSFAIVLKSDLWIT